MTLPCRDVESHTEKHGLKYPIIFISLSNRCFARLPGQRKTALKPAPVYSLNTHCTGSCSQQAAMADLPPWQAAIGKEAISERLQFWKNNALGHSEVPGLLGCSCNTSLTVPLEAWSFLTVQENEA